MKKGLKIFGIILCIIIIIAIIALVIYSNIKNRIDYIVASNEEFSFENSMGIHEVTTATAESFVKSSGTITSFNIQTIDIEDYEKVKEIYISDGQYVDAKTRIMKVTGDTTRYITAPTSGIFFKTQKGEGEYEYKIYNLDEIGVSIQVSEKDVASLQIGQTAIIKIISLEQELEGTVSYISMLPYEGKFTVNINVPYFEGIKFGYTTNVKISTSKNEEAIVIPYEALNEDDDGRYYVILEEYKDYALELEDHMKTFVEVGKMTEDYVEILEGLETGMKIIYWKW